MSFKSDLIVYYTSFDMLQSDVVDPPFQQFIIQSRDGNYSSQLNDCSI